jgi:hypothetical protein
MATLSTPNEPAQQSEQERRQAAIALIQSWRDGDTIEQQEQCDTWHYLETALNAHRTSERKRL